MTLFTIIMLGTSSKIKEQLKKLKYTSFYIQKLNARPKFLKG